jgi:hypothetical protein
MLRNPDTALPLYIMLIIVGFMFGGRWAGVRAAIATAGNTAQTKAATPAPAAAS